MHSTEESDAKLLIREYENLQMECQSRIEQSILEFQAYHDKLTLELKDLTRNTSDVKKSPWYIIDGKKTQEPEEIDETYLEKYSLRASLRRSITIQSLQSLYRRYDDYKSHFEPLRDKLPEKHEKQRMQQSESAQTLIQE